MDDHISREAAIEAFRKKLCCEENEREYAIGFSGIRKTIEALPSAIVRCKDCKHYQFADNRAFGMPVKMCNWFGFEDVDDYDFCSRAERRA